MNSPTSDVLVYDLSGWRGDRMEILVDLPLCLTKGVCIIILLLVIFLLNKFPFLQVGCYVNQII